MPANNILANYEIGESIGLGRFAEVFLAIKRDLGQKVALKILLPQWYENNAVREQFMQQARAIARLKHPRIVDVLDLGEESGRMFMALEYLPLGDLQSWLKQFDQTRPPLLDVTLLVEDIAAALDFIHSHQSDGQPLVHGDVKPGNVLLADEKDTPGRRRAKLGDLGMLSAIQKAVTLSGSSFYPSSSPLYLSPEQASDQPPTPRSDQYALGVMTYEMLTGRVPFSGGSDVTIYQKHKKELPQPPSVLRPDLPGEIDEVLLRALAKDSGGRYPNCAAFARALRQAVEVAEQKRFAALLKAARTALTDGKSEIAQAALESAHQIKPEDAEVKTLLEQTQKTALATRSYDEAAALLESARQEAKILRAQASTYPDPEHLLDELAPRPPAPWRVWLRRWRRALLTALVLIGLVLAGGLTGKIISETQLPDAPLRSTLVPLVWTATLTFTPTLTPTFTPTFTPTATATFTATLTPTNTSTPTPPVLNAGIEIENQQPIILLRRMSGLENAGWVRSLAFSPDGQILASGSDDDIVRVWRISTGELLHALTGHTSAVYSVAFSPNGELLASGSDDGTIRLWRVSTGVLTRTLQVTSNVYSVAFSPDGALLASGSYDGGIRLWNVNTGERIRTLPKNGHSILSVAFSPNGELLASGSYEQAIRLWRISTGELAQTLTGPSSGTTSVAFSPNGELLASGSYDYNIRLWRLSTGKLVQIPYGYTNNVVSSVVFSPDGDLLVSSSYDNTIRVQGLDSHKFSQDLAGYGRSVYSVAFSPNGWWLASSSLNAVFLWGMPRWDTTGTPTLAPTSTITSTPTVTPTVTPVIIQ